MSVSGEVGMAARRTKEEWIGRRESSWEVIRPPGRGAVSVKDWRVRGVEILAASQLEALFCNRCVCQRPDVTKWNRWLMHTEDKTTRHTKQADCSGFTACDVRYSL